MSPFPPIPHTLPPPPSFQLGHWLKGDWHMHCRHSSDSTNNPQARIIGFAEQLGFDYLAITDHDVHVNGAVAQNTWADPEFRSKSVLLFYGAELTAPRGHVNILSSEPYDHQRIFDARNARDWDLLRLKQELGIHWSANHPHHKNHYGFSFDLADSIEVWNTSIWSRNIPNLRIWDDQLLSGRMIGARGGSDNHHGIPDDPALIVPLTIEGSANYVGTPTTWIFATTRSKPALLAALERGRASISANPNNPRVELYADRDGDGVMDMMMGDNARPIGRPVAFEVRLAGGGIAGAAYRVRVIKNREEFGSFLTDAATNSLRFTDTPAADARSYYRVEIEGPQTPYPQVPNSMAQSGSMVALSNPIYFNYDPAF